MKKSIMVLVGDNSPDLGLQITQYLSGKGLNAYSRRNDCEALYSIIKNDKPDAVILNAASHRGNMEHLISSLSHDNTVKFIVLSPFASNDIQKRLLSSGAFAYILMPVSFFEIYNCIIKAVTSDELNSPFHGAAMSFFVKIGIPPHLKGCSYLAYAVELCIIDSDIIHNITSDLYCKIADKFDTNKESVERSIRHTADVACSGNILSYLSDYINPVFYSEKGHLTNSEFIVAVTDAFCREYEKLLND